MLPIDNRLINNSIRSVAPKVHHLTQMDPHIESLRITPIKRRDYFAEVILPKFEGLDMETSAYTENGKRSVQFMKNILPFMVIAEYDPINHKMFIIPDNLGWGTNETGLTTILGHELVHRCQFLDNPHFLDTYKFLVKKVFGSNAFDIDADEDKSYSDFIQPFMTLVEGDATFVQEQLKNEFYQGAKYNTSGLVNILGVAIGLSSLVTNKRGLMKIVMQYQKGKEIISCIYNESGRGAINRLYQLDYKQIDDIFRLNPFMYKTHIK